jgi:hypothetical protein
MTTDTLWLTDFARGPHSKVIVTLPAGEVLLDSRHVARMLRALPRGWEADFDDAALVLTWAAPGRRGRLRLRKCAGCDLRSPTLASVRDKCVTLAQYRASHPRPCADRLDACGLDKAERSAVARLIGRPWKYACGYPVQVALDALEASARRGFVRV